MNTTINKFIIIFSLIGLSNLGMARENINTPGGNTDGGSGDGKKLSASNGDKVMAGCSAGKAQTIMELNNVRMTLLTSGDMWWDLSNARYEVPKNSRSYACFAGSLWFGGYVGGSSLKVSAMTYRQSGIDFWPGPLDVNTVDIDASTCSKYDKHFQFNRPDVDNLYADYLPDSTIDNPIPQWIKDYPGVAPSVDMNQTFYYLAPFHDHNGDMQYDPSNGDYPNYNVTGTNPPQGECKKRLFGDQTMFWVFNDKGNIHSETTGQQIGVEIRAQAFQFSTSDELNDMTFYNFEIINRGSFQLDSTYFAVWVDADLGNYADDYIGCDVGRGLGYIYNGDNYDEDNNGQIGYHDKLPALGCDFFQGPNADIGDHDELGNPLDNDNDGCVNCTFWVDPATGIKHTDSIIPDNILPEQIIMSRFTYYNNVSNPKNGNPAQTGNGIQYYNLIRGLWEDGTPMTYGKNGINSGSVPACKFLYPGLTDPTNRSTLGVVPPFQNWTETNTDGANTPNTVGDRRFIQSAGRFTLTPGSVNYITFGMPFVRTASANNVGAIPLLQAADDKAQNLFDACFKVLDGPDAPDVTIQELQNQFIFYLSNKAIGVSNNNEHKRYHERDVAIAQIFEQLPVPYKDTTDQYYKFEGYQVFQIKDETVSATDLDDENKSRLVFQCDIQNGVGKLVNYKKDPIIGNIPELMVDGADKGVSNSFVINEDKFASGDKKLVNHKTYYFMAVSYGYNNYLPYIQDVPPTYDPSGAIMNHPISGDFMGQKKPYLRGRRNLKIYSAIPHNTNPEAYGTIMNSSYGFGPKITRIEGQGNGGNALDLTDATVASILSHPSNRAVELEYQNGRGPIGVKVTDPLKVVGGNFTLSFKKVKRTTLTNSVTDTIKIGSRDDLDSGKVKRSYGWILNGTYVDANGATQTKQWTSDEMIGVGQEQLLVGNSGELLGLSVTIKQVMDPQPALLNRKGQSLAGDLLESSISFSDGSSGWLTGIADQEGDKNDFNWIRSGSDIFHSAYDDLIEGLVQADPNQVWENVVGGTWAPYRMCAAEPTNGANSSYAPALGYTNNSSAAFDKTFNESFDTRNLASVDVVFTSDKSKWSRCPVIELSHFNAGAEGKQYQFLRRLHRSVDKNGDTSTVTGASIVESDANYISDVGMGWFPGYAINVETGERLNIAFGENSSDAANNGNDMIWNPTSATNAFGGMHYIYVFGHNSDGIDPITGKPADVPRYDAGAALFKMLDYNGPLTTGVLSQNWYNSTATGKNRRSILEAYKDAMWVTLPIIKSGSGVSSAPKQNLQNIPSDCKVRIRVIKPYRYGLAGEWNGNYTSDNTLTTNAFGLRNTFLLSDSAKYVTTDTIGNPTPGFTTPGYTTAQNANFPMYKFSTGDLVPTKQDAATAKDALSMINVVPNPYYGHSQYERTRIDNVIKIVNLPPTCTIRIYSLNGTLMRTLKKDTDDTTDLIWDLKNQKNITVASGLYIIHIDVPGVGEKIIKWFGVMRPIDLQSY